MVLTYCSSNIRGICDPAARVNGLTWSVGDVAAHVAAVLDGYRSLAEGAAPFPAPLAQRQQVIDAALAGVPERRPAMLADRIGDGIEALSVIVGSSRPGQAVNWYAGTTATPAFLGAIVLGEVLVHGWDLATTSGGDTTLDPGGSRLAVLATAAASPLVLTPEGKTVTADLEYRIRGYEPIGIRLANSDAHITTQPMRRPDLWFEGEPGALLLFCWRQAGELKPFLNRSIRIGGRRPWLALRVKKWFESV